MDFIGNLMKNEEADRKASASSATDEKPSDAAKSALTKYYGKVQ